MARDPSSDIPLRGSHAPRVGAGESRAEAATRRVESASATAAANGDGPDRLGLPVEAVEELTEFSAGGAARDRGAVAGRSLAERQDAHQVETPARLLRRDRVGRVEA